MPLGNKKKILIVTVERRQNPFHIPNSCNYNYCLEYTELLTTNSTTIYCLYLIFIRCKMTLYILSVADDLDFKTRTQSQDPS